MSIETATRQQIRLRAAILGATGSGKTATGLLFCTALARHYGGKVGVIDTQHRQSLDYVNTRFAPLGFDVFHLSTGKPEAYINALTQFAKENKYSAVLIDSMTDAWQSEGGVLDQAGDNAQFTDWGPAKRSNSKLLTAIQKAPYHVIATVLADTQYSITTEQKDGKAKMIGVEIIGTKPIQDKKMMPKFGLQLSMDQYHRMTVTRTSFDPYDRMIVEKPGEEWMIPLIEWMEKGSAPLDVAVETRAASLVQIAEFYEIYQGMGLTRQAATEAFYRKYGSKPEDCTEDFLEERLVDARVRVTAKVAVAKIVPPPTATFNIVAYPSPRFQPRTAPKENGGAPTTEANSKDSTTEDKPPS
jgi:hypothetical protein